MPCGFYFGDYIRYNRSAPEVNAKLQRLC